jgi:O-antigen ligase
LSASITGTYRGRSRASTTTSTAPAARDPRSTHHDWFLGAYCLFTLVTTSTPGPVRLQGTQVLALGGFALLAIAWTQHKHDLALRVDARATPVYAGLLAIIVASTLSTLNSVDLLRTLTFTARWTTGAITIVVLSQVLHHRPVLWRRTFSYLLATVVLIGATAAVVALVGAPFGGLIRHGDRVQLFTSNPNQLAILLATTLPVAMAAFAGRRSPWALVAFFAATAGIAATGSKFNISVSIPLAVVATTIVVIALSHAPRPRETVLGLAGIATVAGGLIAFSGRILDALNPRAAATITELIIEPQAVSAVKTRDRMWDEALEASASHRWVGLGADTIPEHLGVAHAHSAVIEFLATMGVVGLLALILFAVACVLATVRAVRWAPTSDKLAVASCGIGILVYLTANLSSDSLGPSTLPMAWLLLALIVSAPRSPRRDGTTLGWMRR